MSAKKHPPAGVEDDEDDSNVISLLGDDEEAHFREAVRRSLRDAQRRRQRGGSCPPAKKRIRGGSDAGAAAAAAAAAGGGGSADVICLLDDGDSDDDGGGKIGACDSTLGRRGRSPDSDSDAAVVVLGEEDVVGGKNGASGKKQRGGMLSSTLGGTSNLRRSDSAMTASSGDVVVLEEAPEPPAAAAVRLVVGTPNRSAAAAGGGSPSARPSRRSARKRARSAADGGEGEDDDDIETVGVANSLRLPHARHDCPDFKFVLDVRHKQGLRTKSASVKAEIEEGLRLNPRRCDLCYCYVCDVPASRCENWTSDDSGGPKQPDDHCLACAKGADGFAWKRLRDEKKGVATAGDDDDSEDSVDSDGTVDRGIRNAAAGRRGMQEFLRQIQQANVRMAQLQRAALAARGVHSGRAPTTGAATRAAMPAPAGSRSSPSSRARVAASRRLQDRLEELYGGGAGAGGSSSPSSSAAAVVGPSSLSSLSSPLTLTATERSVASSAAAAAAGHSLGQGPWPPHDASAASSPHLTRCRRCEWFSCFEHRNFTRTEQVHVRGRARLLPRLHPVSDSDWCHACGRVASERDFGKDQSAPYVRRPDDVFLGTKEVGFRLRPHDPRRMEAFRTNWRARQRGADGWKYRPEEAAEDLFRHRLGERPTLDVVLASIPVLAEEKLPTDGAVRNPVEDRRRGGRASLHGGPSEKDASATECEALLLDDRNGRALLEELHKFGVAKKVDERHPRSMHDASAPVGADIAAKWDKARQKGTFTVRLFLKRAAFMETGSWWKEVPNPIKEGRLSQLLGAWFGIFPFTLVSLTGGIRAQEGNIEKRKRLARQSLPCPPWRLEEEGDVDKYLPTAREEKQAVDDYNKEARAVKAKNSFLPSDSSSGSGGVCSDDSSLAGVLRRYFSERLVDDSRELWGYSQVAPRIGYVGRKMGVASAHRHMRRKNSSYIVVHGMQEPCEFRSYLREEDHALLAENVLRGLSPVHEKTKTLNGLMDQLENLGHAPAPPTEGLTVELLGFQRQAVGWALERENAPGGVQGYCWAKLPKARGADYRGDLYFNPALDMVSKKPPKKARGGFIALEMGLGKTVISLALVLQNPAPQVPASGTEADAYPLDSQAVSSAEGRPGWTPRSQLADDFSPAKEFAGSGKRASVFSRGTLVVCNVSLVGQWIDEAKNKLRDPGLVYSYHGGSRKRDASVLAGKSIVVTTYATLASDATHWAKKAKEKEGEGWEGYCPPCEQVRWWRIICDESHVLKDNSRQTRSVLNLVGENRWCVTGTPTNTGLGDLANQLKFVGIDHTHALFRIFGETMEHHGGGAKGAGRNNRRHSWRKRHETGNFLFLMRSWLIRHTMGMKIRETKINLMSLPPKEERSIAVPFGDKDRKQYDKLEATAREFYGRMKRSARHDLRKHYLKIFGALMPLRQACSGVLAEEGGKDAPDKKKAHRMSPEDDTECSVCLEALEDPVATKCKHVFCRDCIEGILNVLDEGQGPCPICRSTVQVSKLRRAILPDAAGGEGDGKKTKEPAMVFESKLKVLIRELERIRRDDPEAKSLVFSQFGSTIEWMKRELPKHGFQFRTLSGSMPMTKRAKALREFQNDPPTTIFLLSMRAGAVGINLTQANRVFLMEPAMNPALEAQAIGRVHRLGQLKRVEIIRLVVRDSVETRMVKLLERKYGKKDADTDDENNASSGNEGETDDNNDERERDSDEAAKGAPDQGSDAAVGSLKRDKAAVTAEEFDLLFGCSS